MQELVQEIPPMYSDATHHSPRVEDAFAPSFTFSITNVQGALLPVDVGAQEALGCLGDYLVPLQLARHASAPLDTSFQFVVASQQDGFSLWFDGQSLGAYAAIEDVLSRAQREILTHTLCHGTTDAKGMPVRLAAYHAAALAYGDRAVVILGERQHGKTTLTMALMASGWRALSDDVAIIVTDTGDMLPYPRLLHVRPGSFGALAAAGFQVNLSPQGGYLPPDGSKSTTPPPAVVATLCQGLPGTTIAKDQGPSIATELLGARLEVTPITAALSAAAAVARSGALCVRLPARGPLDVAIATLKAALE